MLFRNVALDDFRSYRHAVVELEPGVCVLVGTNGQGKTNFVEALTYLSSLHSHRVSADRALVRFPDADERAAGVAPQAAVIRVKLMEAGRERRVDLEIVAGKANRARVGRSEVPPREVPGFVRTVLFAPEDLEIARGEPSARRRFLDDLAQTQSPVYAAVRSEHEKLLAQRGALLRTASARIRRGMAPDLSTLDVWDEQLSAAAARMIAARVRLVADLTPLVDRAHESVSERSRTLEIDYVSSLSRFGECDLADEAAVRAALLNAYAQVRDDEARRGVTLVGPHRDDLAMTLDGMPVRGYASHGETWSVALSLRLAQFELLREDGEVPVLVLDDVFAELDARRRAALLACIGEADQVLVTAAVREDVPAGLDATLYRVALGEDGASIIEREVGDG